MKAAGRTGRIESDRSAGPKEKPPRRETGPDWSALGLNGPSLQRKRNGPRPVSRIVAGIGGQRRREPGGGDSRLWTPRRRHERMREIALSAAWATRCLVWTSPSKRRTRSPGREVRKAVKMDTKS
ncbi:hypothetical protein CRG98_028304 [Punica granatum]|uniref:Uncharacterized protein n=1 Tax=Punica granatum TaxID=22663 RepID=A0A2I0J5U1_PUNGR|nr:hypothetical protein CRG98_028304 [Punica granatum]